VASAFFLPYIAAPTARTATHLVEGRAVLAGEVRMRHPDDGLARRDRQRRERVTRLRRLTLPGAGMPERRIPYLVHYVVRSSGPQCHCRLDRRPVLAENAVTRGLSALRRGRRIGGRVGVWGENGIASTGRLCSRGCGREGPRQHQGQVSRTLKRGQLAFGEKPQMIGVPRIFRIFWLVLTLGAWLLVISSLLHRSQHPDIFRRYSWPYFFFLALSFGVAVLISVANREKLSKRIYAARYSALLFLIATVLSLTAVETYVRIADPLGISYYEEAGHYHLNGKIADPELIFRHRSSWQTTSSNGNKIRLNEFGLRDEPIPPKERSEYRIIALGDSVTFGFGVDQERIFTVRLQQILASKLEPHVRVINAGVGGYNTVQEHAYLNREGLSFQPDLVLLMYVTNDIEVNRGPFDPWSARSFTDKSPAEVGRLLLGKSWLYRLAYHTYKVSTGRASYESVRGTRGWRDSMEALGKIAGICERNGIPLVVFFWRLSAGPFSDALLDDVRQAVPHVSVQDVSQWFVNKSVHRYTNSRVDGHPNAEAHAIIAENIAAFLLAQRFLRGVLSEDVPR
jgi:GDSL-like Lipase/Acylhydrolase family